MWVRRVTCRRVAIRHCGNRGEVQHACDFPRRGLLLDPTNKGVSVRQHLYRYAFVARTRRAGHGVRASPPTKRSGATRSVFPATFRTGKGKRQPAGPPRVCVSADAVARTRAPARPASLMMMIWGKRNLTRTRPGDGLQHTRQQHTHARGNIRKNVGAQPPRFLMAKFPRFPLFRTRNSEPRQVYFSPHRDGKPSCVRRQNADAKPCMRPPHEA